jgi:hypothetical protein
MEGNLALMPMKMVEPGGFEKSNIKEVREKGASKMV